MTVDSRMSWVSRWGYRMVFTLNVSKRGDDFSSPEMGKSVINDGSNDFRAPLGLITEASRISTDDCPRRYEKASEAYVFL